MPPKRRLSAKDITGFQTGLPLGVVGGVYGDAEPLAVRRDNLATASAECSLRLVCYRPVAVNRIRRSCFRFVTIEANHLLTGDARKLPFNVPVEPETLRVRYEQENDSVNKTATVDSGFIRLVGRRLTR